MATTKTRDNHILDEMVTSYMEASDAAYDTLIFLIDVYGAEDVLKELFEHMDIDKQVEFVHDFIRLFDVDTSGLDDECIEVLDEHYRLHC